VYCALQAITDPYTGVADKNKILLQFSCATAQWKSVDGHIINRTPFTPGYDAVQTRIAQGASAQYSSKYESPYLTFISAEDGAENIVWYENQRSVMAKMRLAALFGVQGVSLWRLGLIPDDIADIFS
jgi:spore germination protein YaaH